MLHLMHHEATACHVTEDIVILLTLMTQILETARKYITDKKCTSILLLSLTHLTQIHVRTQNKRYLPFGLFTESFNLLFV